MSVTLTNTYQIKLSTVAIVQLHQNHAKSLNRLPSSMKPVQKIAKKEPRLRATDTKETNQRRDSDDHQRFPGIARATHLAAPRSSRAAPLPRFPRSPGPERTINVITSTNRIRTARGASPVNDALIAFQRSGRNLRATRRHSASRGWTFECGAPTRCDCQRCMNYSWMVLIYLMVQCVVNN